MDNRQSKLKQKQTPQEIFDQNFNYTGRQWFGTYEAAGFCDEVLLTDPAVSTGWLGLLSVMGQAAIDVKGGPAEVLAFLREMLFKRLDRRFNAVFLDILQALVYGCQAFEVCTKYEAGRWWLTDLVPIPPRKFELETIEKQAGQWWIDGVCNTEAGAVPCGSPESGKALVLWVTYGPGIFGKSILRPILAEHNEKSYIRRLRAVGLSKSVIGTLAAFERAPDINAGGVALTDEQRGEYGQVIATATEAAEKSVVVLPHTIASVQPIYPAADCVSKTTDAEDHADLQILQAFGSQHLARGLLSSYGSQGAGEADSKAQQAMRGYFFEWAASAIQPLLDWLVDINFSGVAAYPELSIISPSPQNPESLVRSYAQLVSAGVIQPTKEDGNFFRRLLRLPSESGQLVATKVAAKGYRNPATGLDTRDPANRSAEYQAAKAVK